MCGIVGIFGSKAHDKGWLSVGQAAVTHRGPDDFGEWWSNDGRVGLAHSRLSIIDLSPGGHQPMLDKTCDICLVFNGEIYNYIELRDELSAKGAEFNTESDTEVIINAWRIWGVKCVDHLNGMFSFALYDAKLQMAFLARDRVGEKPLFYYHHNGTLRFASELKSLLSDPEIPRSINLESLDCFLAMGYVPGDSCILKGFNKLPPAHAMLFSLQKRDLKIWRYWSLPELEENKGYNIDEEDLLDELETLLEDSVRRQLVADVPVGILLSGGVDSSIITAMAARQTDKVKTYTIRFPGYSKLDETEHARLISRHFNTEHTELEAVATSAELLPSLARQFDEPIIDSSMIPTFLVSRLVRRHCTVALGGDGGDELFGGYPYYSKLLWMLEHLGKIPLPLRKLVSIYAGKFLPVGLKGRNWLQGLGVDLEKDLPMIDYCFDSSARQRLMAKHGMWKTVSEKIMKLNTPIHTDLLQRATRMQFQNYLTEDILVKVDRASMLNSLEVRSPILDYRVIEFAFRKVPSSLKASKNKQKILLKKLTERVLPQEFNRQRKQGFSIPLNEWLRAGTFRDLFKEVLYDNQSIFDQSFVKGLLKGQAMGLINGERLFGLVIFELWRREYRVSL
jgi:asparagine synthase (glutamine-hydrolysing)